jgi:hypothetical protein
VTVRRNKRGRHGQTGSPTYRVWQNMRLLCDNPRHRSYGTIGGRGITYDPRWASYAEFFKDVGEKPYGSVFSRVDLTQGYFPGNVEWRPLGRRRRLTRTSV